MQKTYTTCAYTKTYLLQHEKHGELNYARGDKRERELYKYTLLGEMEWEGGRILDK